MNPLHSMRFAFIGILLFSAVSNLCVPWALDRIDNRYPLGRWSLGDVAIGIINGLLIGEFLSIAFWMLLDPISLLRKLFVGVCAGFLFASCLIIGVQVWPDMPRAAAFFFWLVGVFLPLAFALFLWILAVLFGRKVLPLRLAPRRAGQAQYGIGFLLFSMLAVAIALTVVRTSLPDGRQAWLSAIEFLSVAFWFFWLATATSLYAWIAFAMILRPTLYSIGATILLTLLGPAFFQLVASSVLPGRFGMNFRLFEPLPHSVAIGVLIASVILGLIYRVFVQSVPPSPVPAAPSVGQL